MTSFYGDPNLLRYLAELQEDAGLSDNLALTETIKAAMLTGNTTGLRIFEKWFANKIVSEGSNLWAFKKPNRPEDICGPEDIIVATEAHSGWPVGCNFTTAPNKSILISGMSGSGKTVLMQRIAVETKKKGMPCIIYDPLGKFLDLKRVGFVILNWWDYRGNVLDPVSGITSEVMDPVIIESLCLALGIGPASQNFLLRNLSELRMEAAKKGITDHITIKHLISFQQSKARARKFLWNELEYFARVKNSLEGFDLLSRGIFSAHSNDMFEMIMSKNLNVVLNETGAPLQVQRLIVNDHLQRLCVKRSYYPAE